MKTFFKTLLQWVSCLHDPEYVGGNLVPDRSNHAKQFSGEGPDEGQHPVHQDGGRI